MSTATNSEGYRFGYARVSTLEQDEALQRDALVAVGCQRILVEKASASSSSGPPWRSCLVSCAQGTASRCGGWTASAGPCATSSMSWRTWKPGVWRSGP